MPPANDSERFDPYYQWLAIPPKDQPPNHYRLLGVELFEANPDVIENAADKQTVHLRTFQLSKYRDLAEKLLNEIAAARICLLNPPKRAIYDAQLRERRQGKRRKRVARTSDLPARWPRSWPRSKRPRPWRPGAPSGRHACHSCSAAEPLSQ